MSERRTFLPTTVSALGVLAFVTSAAAGDVQVNRPRSIFQCDQPVGRSWYGSTERCLDELCRGADVISVSVLDDDNHLRRNPCYGQPPAELRR